jgi:RNA polymerase sigma-70 factor (ECF subfamily)
MRVDEQSDEALLAALKTSSPEEKRRLADELFQRYYVRVSRWCYRFIGDEEEAADLAQEVFIKAYRHLDAFRGDSRFSTWLYAIVRHEALSRHRRKPPHVGEESADVLESLPAVAPLPDSVLETESRRQQIARLLADTLDDAERNVFVLHYGDDMTLEQITRMLALANTGGAKAFLVRARRKLARAVQRMRARGEAL